MTLKGPDSYDLPKLHAEVNQLLNQRFIVTTFAITVFAVVSAWLIPRDPPMPGSALGGFVFVGSIVLTSLLFIIFLLWFFLRCMRFVLTTYLRVTNKSNWENDFKQYRKKSSLAYSKPQTVVFLILNLIATLFPLLLSIVYDLELEPHGAFLFAIILGAIYEILMYGIGFRNWFDRESEIESYWRAIDTETASPGQTRQPIHKTSGKSTPSRQTCSDAPRQD